MTERRSHEAKGSSRGKRDAEGEKWDVAPDGGSAGREGRQFTVANVGNNGRIYLRYGSFLSRLTIRGCHRFGRWSYAWPWQDGPEQNADTCSRPTVRPAHQRYPQPKFSFPASPQGTGSIDALFQKTPAMEGDSDLHQSQWTPSPRPSPLVGQKTPDPAVLHSLNTPSRHRRALSDSTVPDGSIANDSEAGAFRIVISKPNEDQRQRPKTTEDLNPTALPHLDINIPSWRIGVPRFTQTGTPLIRGSSYAPSFAQSDDIQSVNGSMFDRSQKDLNVTLPPLGPRRPSALNVPQFRLSRSAQRRSPGLISPKGPHPLRSAFMPTRTVIDPPMYDDLTFKPACDDRSIVRYAPATGAVTAATPARLVAEITSPSFLDYELISDFFLTFRAFLEPPNLLHMLIARLRWAAARNDEVGMIVHVRAFVAMRHWILNYFMDDFVVDYDLRVDFCGLLNDLVDDFSREGQARKVQLKILNELKKCWRRVCAQYWDGPDFEDVANPEALIAPGGIAGNRDPDLNPSFWEREDAGAIQLNGLFSVPETLAATGLYADVSQDGHAGKSAVVEQRPRTPEDQETTTDDRDLGLWSPGSLGSIDIISCSFPSKEIRNMRPHTGRPLGAHPVSSSSLYNQAGPIATTPKALVGKRVRANQHHQRNNSLPELPEDKELDKVTFKDHDFLMVSPHAGSLVRGDVLPPGKPFVEVAPSGGVRQTTIFETEDDDIHNQEGGADAMSGRGMRRLIGSVRRALSTRGQGTMPTHGLLINSVEVGTARATTTRLPGTAVVPQQPLSRDGARPPVRIDLLGAEVAEDFRRAVREDAAAESAKHGIPSQAPQQPPIHETDEEYSAAHVAATTFDTLPRRQEPGPLSETGLTGGSQSIVIVDDTVPVEGSVPHTRLPTATPSVEAFADTFMPNAVNPTPPRTPPANHVEMARRSSHLLNENIRNAISPEPSLPFVHDFATLGRRSSAAPSEVDYRFSHSGTSRSNRRPPPSGGLDKMHRRNKSSRTQRSLNSVLHGRNGSFSSAMAPPSIIQRLDATTYARYSADEDEDEDDADGPVPKPPRVLRRRPGGDLRAATNVEELDHPVLRRSHSLGSLAAYTESLRSSGIYSHRPNSEEHLDSLVSGHYPSHSGVFSVGQLADNPPKRELSLCSTRSSKPVMRPSFEAEAKKLAQIPDDEDDGGVESALLKLEGKFDKLKPKLSMELRDREYQDLSEGCDSDMTSVATSVVGGDRASRWNTEQQHWGMTVDNNHDDDTYSTEADFDQDPAVSVPMNHLDIPRTSTAGEQSFLSDASRESYSSIPLLDRGLTDDGQSKGGGRNWADRSVLQDEDDVSPALETGAPNEQHMSFDFIHKTESMDNIKAGETVRSSVDEEQSFLDSDISSELSVDDAQTDMDGRERTSVPRDGLPAHPLGGADASPSSGFPSPPNSHGPHLDATAGAGKRQRLSEKDRLTLKPLPPTPEATPGASFGPRSPFDLIGTARPPFEPEDEETDAFRIYSVHLPFILAFDSETLAQQFTLIEKDALNEIDWKELVDMDWKSATNSHSRSWVDFLRNTDAQGVEVVIARFNLVVKWAISEIVLTQHIEERARCLIKFIHVAAHCRYYRNFATLAQLTIALSSNEVSRLARTWELVPPKDMRTLRELETLVTPMRNFFNLRAEMESGPDTGCIPFVGIYTHDLLYNAQRPSEIASSPTTAPLVNFERCRIGAGVVKTLLRLLEASSRYNFQPREGITERCLWIGALTDDEIRRHSGNLE